MKKSIKLITAAIFTALICQTSLVADATLAKEIFQLEWEISKMENKIGEYENMSPKELEKKLNKAKKELADKKTVASKELEIDKEGIKEGLKKTGENLEDVASDIQKAGRKFGANVKNFLDEKQKENSQKEQKK